MRPPDASLHCGLCAERCPTGAWDMKQFWFDTAKANDVCAAHRLAAE